MTEPVSMATRDVASAASAAPTGSGGPGADPADARWFAHLMQGASADPAASAPGMRDAVASAAERLGPGAPTFDELRRSMLASIDMSDPIKTMLVLTDHSMQANASFARLHIASGLASAATSLFGSLLRNPQ